MIKLLEIFYKVSEFVERKIKTNMLLLFELVIILKKNFSLKLFLKKYE